MPGLDIQISVDEIKIYKDENPYGDIPLKDWIKQYLNIPDYQNVNATLLDGLNLKGIDLSFVNFQGLIIKECEFDDSTNIIGANLNNTVIIDTSLGDLPNLGLTTMQDMVIDEESSKAIDDLQLTEQRRSLLNTVALCQPLLITKNPRELQTHIASIKDPFEANVAIKFYNSTNPPIPPKTDTTKALKNKIFALINYHPEISEGVTFQEIQAVQELILAQSTDLALYPKDIERIKTECVDKIIDDLNKGIPLDQILEQTSILMQEWRNNTPLQQQTFETQIEIVARNTAIREIAHKLEKNKTTSMSEKAFAALSDSLYQVFVKSKDVIIGGLIGGLIGISQSSSVKGALVKGAAGAALGATAIKKIPQSISPFEASDWPTINPADTNARNRDIALKMRGLFWCTMIAGGAIEGLSGDNLGIAPIATVVSSFGLLKELLPLQSLAGTQLEDPKRLDHFVSEELNPKSKDNFLYKCKQLIADYSDILDSQLGDRLLEAGTIMEQLEPRLGIILANRQFMKITQLGSPGLLGNMLTTGESIQNFFSLWSIKNNYLAISEALKQEKEKPFMERNRPGSVTFTKTIDKKMFLKKVTARSIFSVATLSIAFTLGTPLFGAAASAFGMPIAIIGVTAALAVVSTAYIVKSYFGSPIKTTALDKSQKKNHTTSVKVSNTHDTPTPQQTKPTPTPTKNPTVVSAPPLPTSGQTFVEKLQTQRGGKSAASNIDATTTRKTLPESLHVKRERRRRLKLAQAPQEKSSS
jgi:hypothetical protein